MRDISTQLAQWHARGEDFALATVVRTWRSSPRMPGASMAVSRSGEVVGSVSGGCIESALYEIAQEVLADGTNRVEVFSVSDDDAIGVGLTCGGTIEVFVQAVGADFAEFGQVCERIEADTPVVVVTEVRPGAPARHLVVEHGRRSGDLDATEDEVSILLRTMDTGESVAFVAPAGTLIDSQHDLLVEIFAPLPRMYVFGAIDFAASMCTLGAFAGYRVTVVDARPVFATRARFPDAHDLVVMWPHKFLETAPIDNKTVLAVLTHDEKFDIPLLEIALRSPAAYVGAMGSRATHERRVALLKERGVTDAELGRLHSPIGLDLGARTPEETAVSILAEMTKTLRNASGLELRDLQGPIHPPPQENPTALHRTA
ncbi:MULTISPECIES: XdhC family protein [Rhodococcus]|uniref:XdhC family protein n=1 Tax=Rhodococcus TaxID=1827 RepID=UPI000DBFB9CC|nr:XdhC family protein [Rhodococcus sp. AQ5-07]RAL35611.1 XshC-Cox1 family protein [Rhodococcus sp. AQ5-07]